MAIEPINYLAQLPQQNFLRDIQTGAALGTQIRGVMDQQRQAEQAKAAAQQYNADVANALKSPTPQAFSALALKYPQQREAIKQAWDGMDAGERKAQGDVMTQAYSALLSGQPELAKQVTQTYIDARKNSGMDVASEENILKVLEADPSKAQAALAFLLSHTTDPEKFAENFGKLGGEQRAQEQAPFELSEKKSKAEQAAYDTKIKAVTAKYADSNAIADLEKKKWDVTKIVEDIKIQKEQNRIAAMNAAISRETNQIKKQELQQKVDEAKEKREEKIREKVSTAEAAAASIDNLSSTVDRILKNPSLNDVLGAVEGRIPALTSDESADAIALIDQLGSQAFIAQIPSMKGTGSLTEKEGDKLQASLQNLSRKQSEAQFTSNLKEVQRLMTKARDRLQKSTGIPLSAPDRPNQDKPTTPTAPAIAPGWTVTEQ